MKMVAGQARRWPDLRIETLDISRLDPRDAGFARALYDQIITRWLTLRGLTSMKLENKEFFDLEPAVASGLLCGAAQILFMEKVPIRAAVGESVGWVRAQKGMGAGGLVNAVLRRVCEMVAWEVDEEGEILPGEPRAQRREHWNGERDELPLPRGGALVLDGDILPKDRFERLSLATSHPVDLLRVWSKSMAADAVRTMAAHGIARPPIILNTGYLRGELPEGMIPHELPGHHVFVGDYALLDEGLKRRTDLWVQDPASSLAVESVRELKPGVVIDVCAGMGTKTRQLAAAFEGAQIIATDIDQDRFRELSRVFEGHDRVRVVAFDKLVEWHDKADLVFLDVPCSNTGVLARRIEARYRFSRQRTEQLTAMQRQILADSVRLLKGGVGSGSKILYSTCSLDEQENEAQAKWAARWHDLEIIWERRRLPGGGPGQLGTAYSDGSFAALLG